MRRVPLTPLGWVLSGLVLVAAVGGLAGASTVAWIAVAILLVLLLGALAPASTQNLQVRTRVRPPDIPIIPPRDRPVARRRGSGPGE